MLMAPLRSASHACDALCKLKARVLSRDNGPPAPAAAAASAAAAWLPCCCGSLPCLSLCRCRRSCRCCRRCRPRGSSPAAAVRSPARPQAARRAGVTAAMMAPWLNPLARPLKSMMRAPFVYCTGHRVADEWGRQLSGGSGEGSEAGSGEARLPAVLVPAWTQLQAQRHRSPIYTAAPPHSSQAFPCSSPPGLSTLEPGRNPQGRSAVPTLPSCAPRVPQHPTNCTAAPHQLYPTCTAAPPSFNTSHAATASSDSGTGSASAKTTCVAAAETAGAVEAGCWPVSQHPYVHTTAEVCAAVQLR